jgi:hypothetical protein
MTNYFCAACMLTHATMDDCALLRVVLPHEVEPATPDTNLDAVVLRLHMVRAALRGVLVEGRRAGLVLSPETAALVAASDAFEP